MHLSRDVGFCDGRGVAAEGTAMWLCPGPRGERDVIKSVLGDPQGTRVSRPGHSIQQRCLLLNKSKIGFCTS